MPERSTLIWLFLRFSGRIGRAAYGWATLFATVLMAFVIYRLVMELPASYFEQAAASEMGLPPLPQTPAIEFWTFVLVVGNFVYDWVLLALTAKRLHDIGRSGWWALLLFVFGLFMSIILCFLPGDPRPNRYGNPQPPGR